MSSFIKKCCHVSLWQFLASDRDFGILSVVLERVIRRTSNHNVS